DGRRGGQLFAQDGTLDDSLDRRRQTFPLDDSLDRCRQTFPLDDRPLGWRGACARLGRLLWPIERGERGGAYRQCWLRCRRQRSLGDDPLQQSLDGKVGPWALTGGLLRRNGCPLRRRLRD